MNTVIKGTKKEVFAFRAEADKIAKWKMYASNAGMELTELCTAAIDNFIDSHQLTGTQKQAYEMDLQTYEAKKNL